MKVYTHLRLEKREKIFKLRQNGAGIRHIAKIINRDKATISRELKPNQYTDSIVYLPDKANSMAKKRKYTLELKTNRFPRLKNYVIEKLRNK